MYVHGKKIVLVHFLSNIYSFCCKWHWFLSNTLWKYWALCIVYYLYLIFWTSMPCVRNTNSHSSRTLSLIILLLYTRAIQAINFDVRVQGDFPKTKQNPYASIFFANFFLSRVFKAVITVAIICGGASICCRFTQFFPFSFQSDLTWFQNQFFLFSHRLVK